MYDSLYKLTTDYKTVTSIITDGWMIVWYDAKYTTAVVYNIVKGASIQKPRHV